MRALALLLLLALPASAIAPVGARSPAVIARAAPVDTCGAPPSTDLRVWLDARSVDGAGNATLANNDPVSTWVDLGSIGDDPGTATGSMMPTFIASCISGAPCVRFDGGDRILSATAASYAFLHDGTGSTIYTVAKTSASAIGTVVSTATGGNAVRGIGHRYNTTFRAGFFMSDGSALRVNLNSGNNALTSGAFDIMASRLFNEATPARVFVNGTQVASGGTATFSSSDPATALSVGATSAAGSFLTGDIIHVLIYADAHDDAERGAVETWIECVHGEMPVS